VKILFLLALVKYKSLHDNAYLLFLGDMHLTIKKKQFIHCL
jgi:hypothetical protein